MLLFTKQIFWLTQIFFSLFLLNHECNYVNIINNNTFSGTNFISINYIFNALDINKALTIEIINNNNNKILISKKKKIRKVVPNERTGIVVIIQIEKITSMQKEYTRRQYAIIYLKFLMRN